MRFKESAYLVRLGNVECILFKESFNIIVDGHQKAVASHTRYDHHEVCREFTLEMREIPESTSNDEDHDFHVCIHGVFGEVFLFQKLQKWLCLAYHWLTSIISSSIAALREYGSYLLTDVVDSEKGWVLGEEALVSAATLLSFYFGFSFDIVFLVIVLIYTKIIVFECIKSKES